MESRRDECQTKHERVVAYLDRHDLDGVVLTRRCNFAWYTAGGLNHVPTASDVGVTSLFITRDGALAVTNNIEEPRIAAEELADVGIEVRGADWHDGDALTRVWCDTIGQLRVACDAPGPGLPQHVQLLASDFARLRWAMMEGEIERYRLLGREVGQCLESSCREAHPGVTEHELAGRLAGRLVERGIRTPVILMAADDRVRAYRHPIPTDRRFERYGMAVAGGERHGLTVSATRLFSFGPIDDDLRRRHEAVCRVDAAMIGATRPGRTLGEVIAIAQRVYADAGCPDEWQLHHQGGSTGYLGREVKATPDDPTVIETHQAFAWNPSIAGTKSEDTILVGPDTNEILSATGDWPTTTYESGDHARPRCDILEM